MSPPGQEAASAHADTSWNPITYSDPTAEAAIRLIEGGGPFTITAQNGFRIFLNKESLEYMLRGTKARVSRGGKLWINPISTEKETTPAAVEFGDMNSSRGYTETPNQKEGISNV